MKHFKLFYLGLLLILISSQQLFSQAPDGVNYQAVVRGPLGLPLNNQAVSVRFSIHQGSPTGTVVFTETHATTTNQLGLINLELGSINNGAFSAINWSTGGAYYLQIEVDAGSGFDDLGASQLLSVPYALFAKSAATGVQGFNSLIDTVAATAATCPNGGYEVRAGLDANANTVLDAGEVTSSFVVCNGLNGAANVNDTSATNEIQTLSINTTNDTIFLSNGGGFVVLPSLGVDNDWVQGTGIVYNNTDLVGIGTATPIHSLTVVSTDTVIASFTGTGPDAAVISVWGTNPNAFVGSIFLSGSDSAIIGLDPTQGILYLANNTPNGHVVVAADSSVSMNGISVGNVASNLIYNKSPSIYNEADTIFNYSTSGANLHVNQGAFMTDSLYLLGGNLTPGYVLANGGNGKAVWIDPSTLSLGGVWQSNTPDIYFNTGKVGVGTTTPFTILNVVSPDTIGIYTQGTNVFGTFNVTQSLANGMTGELYITGADTVFQSLEPLNNSFSINYPKVGGKIKLQTDTVQFSANGLPKVVTQNIGDFYNKDTIYTDGLYVNDNAGTIGNVLTDVGGGRAQWQGLPQPINFSVNSSTTAISSGTLTQLVFNNIEYDNGGNFNGGLGQFQAPETGVYHIDATVTFDASTNYEVQLQILRNGGTYKTVVVYTDATNNYTTAHISADVYIAINNSVSIGVLQNSSGTIVPSGIVAFSRVYFNGHLVR
ncbi:MAG: hypothetical protein JKX68_03595 [Flavobacteriales bacterium]|nr:hypothetical protein [Flavobacteriales bacterium]